MKKWIGILAIIVALVIGFLFLPSRNEPEPEPIAAPQATPQNSKPSPGAIPSPTDWSSVDEETLEDWITELSSDSFDIVLGEDDTFLTDGVEVSPGVFRFTEIRAKQERDIIHIYSMVREVDLSGRSDLLSMPSIFSESGRTAKVEVFNGSEENASSYTLELTATQAGENSVKLVGKETHR